MKETGKVGRKKKSYAQISREKKGELFHYIENWSLPEEKERNLLIVF